MTHQFSLFPTTAGRAPECGLCRHLWKVTHGTRCGKEGVRQTSLTEARDRSGDCGPEGRFYEPEPCFDGCE